MINNGRVTHRSAAEGAQFSRKWVLGGAFGAEKLKLWYCTKSINVNAIFSVQRVYVLQLGARKRCVFCCIYKVCIENFFFSWSWIFFFREISRKYPLLRSWVNKVSDLFVGVVHTCAVQQFYFDFLYFSRYVFSYEVKRLEIQ